MKDSVLVVQASSIDSAMSLIGLRMKAKNIKPILFSKNLEDSEFTIEVEGRSTKHFPAEKMLYTYAFQGDIARLMDVAPLAKKE